MIKNISKFSFMEEKVYIETCEHIITGTIVVPVDSNRKLSDALNSCDTFIVLKNCKLEYKQCSSYKDVEKVKFMEINKNSIIFVKYLNK